MKVQSRVPKGWIYFAQIFGTIFAAIILFVYIDMFSVYATDYAYTEQSALLSTLIGAILIYMLWKTIYTAFIIISFVKNNDDNTIVNNRFVLSALSLSLGGFFTPLVLTRLPNVTSSSTINPKVFIAQKLGTTLIIGSGIFALYYFLTINSSMAVGSIDLNSTYNIIALSLSAAGFGFGIISLGLFFGKKATDRYKTNNFLSKIMKFIAYIWVFIATIELIIVWFLALIRLIGAVYDMLSAFGSNNRMFKGLIILAAMARFFLTLIYTMAIMRMIGETIAGIWKKNDIIEYYYWDSLNTAQHNYNTK